MLLLFSSSGGAGPPVVPCWPAKTYIPGTLFTAADGNNCLSGSLTDLRTGAIAISGQTTNDFLFASSATQWDRITPAAGQIPKFNGTTWEMVQPLDLAWPVGSVYRSVVATNPSSLIGVGTWESFGSGRVTVAFDAGDADFDVVEETGGSKTVTLTEAQLPSHAHTQNSHNHTQNAHDHTVTNLANVEPDATNDIPPPPALVGVIDNQGTFVTNTTTATNIATTAVNQSTGGGVAHNNLMPYIVCYAWKRTA